MDAITSLHYSEWQQAFDFFNQHLFNNRLPHCLITLQRGASYYGYFSGNRFSSRLNKHQTTDEIAMNPAAMMGRPDRTILSTLVHEMTHLEQHHFGKPGRRGYHNKAWGDLMKAVGLYPTSTGAPGGKETGDRVTHYIVEDGPFDKACAELLAGGLKLSWHDPYADERKAKKKSDRTKYSCEECGFNAWAKPGADLRCGECDLTRPMLEEVK